MLAGRVIFASILLLWQPSQSTTCTAAYSQSGHVLINHVIQTFMKVTSSQECIQKCAANVSCNSINLYTDRGLCELNNATHLSSPGDLVQAHHHASYMLYFLHPLVVCSNQLCSDLEICLMNSDGISYRCQHCNDALGMEDGRITDSQITASSIYDGYHAASLARLHNNIVNSYTGSWSSLGLNVGEYLQIDLSKVMYISRVATQGRPAAFDQWVTKYSLKYSLDGSTWSWVRQNHDVKEFHGNSDRDTVVTNALPNLIKARYIRIVALSWNNHISMRAELYGCANL